MAELPANPEQPPEPPVPARPRCANCGAGLHGPYCHQCGQSTRHVLKHLPALVEDGLDLVFNIDGRIMRTLPTLYFRPGYLAREYFAGRRVRYIPPFRLMFFLSVLAFLVMQFNLNLPGDRFNVEIGPPSIHGNTPAQVHASYAKADQGIREARKIPHLTAKERAGLDASERKLRASANEMLRQLGAPPPEAAANPAGPASNQGTATTRQNGTLPQPSTEPAAASVPSMALPDEVRVAWLPGFLARRIDAGLRNARANLHTVQSGSKEARDQVLKRTKSEMLSVLPQALFVMLPLFAVLLKIVYLFRRSLYIEHLMVAMYSHAYIYLSLLLLGVLGLLRHAAPAWLASPMGLLEFAILAWMPVYLLLMQKRVYAQGWPMTLLKYLLVGVCYTILVSCAVASAALIGFAS